MAEGLPLATLVLASGALGTAAFGIVDGLKGLTWLAEAGFGHIRERIIAPFAAALAVAYGSDHERVLRAHYQDPNGTDALVRALRQGVRLGLTPATAEELAKVVGVVDPARLKEVAVALVGGAENERAASPLASDSAPTRENGPELTEAQRGVLGRFELAVDARVDAALTLAERRYRTTMRVLAGTIAVALAELTALALSSQPEAASMVARSTDPQWLLALIVGTVAIPLAPVAKDVASGISAAAKALEARK